MNILAAPHQPWVSEALRTHQPQGGLQSLATSSCSSRKLMPQLRKYMQAHQGGHRHRPSRSCLNRLGQTNNKASAASISHAIVDSVRTSTTTRRASCAPTKFAPFDEAREFARSQNLSSVSHWKRWCKEGKRPPSIPYNPDLIYRSEGWVCWPDWLGYDGQSEVKFMPFAEAREYVRSQNLRSAKEWKQWCKEGNRPAYIPYNPNRNYGDSGWVSWPDWLGYDNPLEVEFLPFEEAREFVHRQKLQSIKDWQRWSAGGNRPPDVPSAPDKFYANAGWVSWPNWMGYESRRELNYLPYEEARWFAQSLKLGSAKAWGEWCRQGARPADVPSRPDQHYRDSGWVSWFDFLGNNRRDARFAPFEDARELARGLSLADEEEWRRWCNSGARPEHIPFDPVAAYEHEGWVSWPDWLGAEYLSFDKARAYARSLNLQSAEEWEEYDPPAYIPPSPVQFYREKGWESWYDWLGLGAKCLPFEEARAYARGLELVGEEDWRQWCKDNKQPRDVPARPDLYYRDKGWGSWYDWLGCEYADVTSLPFEQAREFARSLRLGSADEWRQWRKYGRRPPEIPSSPNTFYRGKGWESWRDWLGYSDRAVLATKARPVFYAQQVIDCAHQEVTRARSRGNVLVCIAQAADTNDSRCA